MWGDPTDIPLEDSKLKRKLNTPGGKSLKIILHYF
jgi:hypothetical protein